MTSMLGIDFGTSTSLVAMYGDGMASVLRNPAGEEITPSFVAYPPDGKAIVGRAARARRLIDSNNTLFAFKRILGRTWYASEVRSFIKQYPLSVECGHDNLPRFVTRAGKLTAGDVATQVFAYLRKSPTLAAQEPVQAVLTVPVTFRKEQREALVHSALRAGFRAVELVEEPCAAALAALRSDARDQVVVVYDLGGGTFDVTVLQSVNKKFQVLATGGDSYLGGDDITARCADAVVEQVLEQYRWNIRSSMTSMQKLLYTCDNLKTSLSFTEKQEVSLTGIDEILKDKSVTLTRQHLEKISHDLVQRTFVICDETMRNAGVNPAKVDAVVLSGGCCYMPVVRESVKAYFGQEPKMQVPPDKVVALGAALQAGESLLPRSRAT